MGHINIFKIDEINHNLFIEAIKNKYGDADSKSKEIVGDVINTFLLTLYIFNPSSQENDIDWEWLANEFEYDDVLYIKPNPKAILVIKHDNSMYAITFGTAYFDVDKYCDRSFAFSFARNVKFTEIKSTSLSSPHLKRNKTVNTFKEYDELDFNSGESFAKIKANISVGSDNGIFSNVVEIGNSLKFNIFQNSITSILNVILYIEEISARNRELNKIPVYSKVKNQELLDRLETQLRTDIASGNNLINISELDIIGVTEIFNHNDSTFKLKHKRHELNVSELSFDQLQLFTTENNIDYTSNLLDIKVISHYQGETVKTEKIKNLIDYTNDNERCFLSKGKWYQYNDDYITYITNSIAELDVEYIPKYNFNKLKIAEFINRKFSIEKNEEQYNGKSDDYIIECLKKKYYAERAFNLIMEEEHNFENSDRIVDRIKNSKIEMMDLYKDKTIFAVKKGSTSAKLCYAIDQSISSLYPYKHKLLGDLPNIENVAIWFILERTNHLPITDGKPDLNVLEMITLKNKLDYWKKEVRLLGYKPKVYVNYVVNGGDE